MRLISPYEQQYQYANMYPTNIGGADYSAPPTFKYNGDISSIQQPSVLYNYDYNTQSYIPSQNQNTLYNYDQYYNPYNQEVTQSYGPIFDTRAKLSEQYYYQAGYNPTIIDANGNAVSLRPNNSNDWYYNYYDMYNRQQEQQKQMQEHQKEQLSIMKRLQKVVNVSLGIENDIDNTVDHEKIAEEWQKQQQIMQENTDIMNKQYLFEMINQSQNNSLNPEYRSFDYMNYTSRWNSLYEKQQNKYPKNYTLYEFFNQGIAENMYMDMKIDQANEKARQLCNLYNQDNFRRELARLHPSYDPYDNNVISPERLTIDDMEVTLPPSLSGKEYQQRRERFFSSIMQSVPI